MALANVNVRFGVDLREFRSKMQSASKSLNRFGSQMKRSGAELSAGLTAPIVALGAVSFNVFQKFELEMAKVKAVSGATAAEFKMLSDNAKELGASTIFSASQVAGLQLEFAKLGFTASEIEKVTGATLALAQASGSELPRAAEVAGSTLRAFGLSVEETQRVTDVMAKSFSASGLDMESFAESMKYVAPVAASAGVSIEETAAMLGVLANNGVKGSQAGTALRRIISDIGATGKPVGEAIAALAARGLDLGTAMDEVGRNAQTALLILGKSGKETQGLAKDFEGAKGSAAAMAAIMDDTSAGGVAAMKSALEGLAISMGELLSGFVTPIIKGIGRFATMINNLSKPMKMMILVVSALAAAVGPLLIAIGFVSTAMATLGAATLPITGTILAVIAAIGLLSAAGVYLYENWDAVVFNMKKGVIILQNAMVEGVAKMVGALDLLFGPLGIGIFGRAADEIRKFKKEIPTGDDATKFKSFGETIKKTGDSIKETIGGISGGLGNMGGTLSNGLDKVTESGRKAVAMITNLSAKTWQNMTPDGQPPRLFQGPTPDELEKANIMVATMERQARVTENIHNLIGGATGAFEEFFTTLVDGGENAFGAIIRYLKRLVIQIAAAAAAAAILSVMFGGLGAGFSFRALMKSFSGIDIGARAYGGPVSSSMPYIVGERGPELFVPSSSGRIVPNNMMNKNGQSNVVVSGAFRLSGTNLIAAIDSSSERVKRTNPGIG